MDDLISEFIAETRDMLEALGGEIVAWEAAPADRSRLDEIFRFVHTVKGNSGFFDLPRIQALSHAAEDSLAAVRAGTRMACPQLVSAVLAVIDRIGELVEDLETGESLAGGDDEPLIAALGREAVAPEAQAGAAPASQAPRAAVRSIRLPVDLLDRMMSGVSDLVLARNELARRLRDSDSAIEIGSAFERVSATIADLRQAVTRTRMQRIEALFAPLPRMVRDLSAETGKPVTLEIDGGEVELDREMIEMIRDPLTHIIRNAVDHGIEPAEARRRAGKPESGLLSICARQAGNQILIDICDDGAGIDGEALVRKAIAAGTLSRARAEAMTAGQQSALIFEPGLSTAAEVTALSGRGVGMDVVRANIERIGGVVDVHSEPGQGVRLTLRVPLTLTIIPALTIRVGGQRYALPRSAIEEIVRVKGGAVRIEQVGGTGIATVRGRRLPLVSLSEVLGVAAEAEPDEATLIVLKPAGADLYALAVDQVDDHEELVVKPAAPSVMAAGLYAGTTLADDGRPVLLLDPPGIAARAGVALERRDLERAASAPAAVPAEGVAALLFRTLAGAKRLVPLAAIERIEEVPAEAVSRGGGRATVTVGERILPLEGGEAPASGRLRLLCLSDGRAELAYALAEVVEIIEFAGDVLPAAAPGEVRGIALIAGEQVELLDLHWLFAHRAAGSAAQERPVCALPGGDAWIDAFLRPLIESAGYRTVRAGEPGSEKADLVVVSAENESSEPAGPARVLRIRAAPEPLREGDDSIHRYDRESLIAALGRRAGGERA
jgi:two-component system chemotaxis sensor kinase CheA